ncbi:PEP-CTERM sorting domain-containing protein [Eleftheria terrae]|uniref:PEP-CTERM sorting domain-containing protein n=1 Tax=Eleftheria terrae TaxID=1597781 RepID=UPI00263A68A0|nr:PEP-CTERM sorting domain-containing protein [Eleftheria terrae]WKB51352.1 PEP-CTERM sorting domain-containing protein [Eleftheria terrae]
MMWQPVLKLAGTTVGVGGLWAAVSSVPEPETFALLLAGLLMVLVLSRRCEPGSD